MITFEFWQDFPDGCAARISINPSSVAAVTETYRRRSYSGYNDVSVIKFNDGSEVCVVGHVADKIAVAGGNDTCGKEMC